MKRGDAVFHALSLCGALVIPAYANSPHGKTSNGPPASGQEKPLVTGMLPIVLTDDVTRLKVFYRDVVGLSVQSDEGSFIRFETGQSHVAIMDRGVVGRIV